MANNFVNVESVEVKYFDTLPVVVRKVQALGYDAETARRAALDIYSKGVGRRGAQVPWHGIGEFPANVVPVQALQSDIDARETYIEENLPPVEEVDDDNIKKIINAVTFTFSSNRTSRELFEAIQLSSTVPFACFKDRVRINSSSSFLAAAAFKQLPHGQCICSQKHIGASLNDNIRIKISRREPRYMFRGPSLNAEEFYAHAVIKVNSDSGTCDVLVRIETPAEKEWYSQSLREAIGSQIIKVQQTNLSMTYDFPDIQSFNSAIMDDLIMNNLLVSKLYRVNDRKSATSRSTSNYRLYSRDEKTRTSVGPSFSISLNPGGGLSVNLTALTRAVIKPHIKLISATLLIYQKYEREIKEQYDALLLRPKIKPYNLAVQSVSDKKRGKEIEEKFVVKNSASSLVRAEMVGKTVPVAMQQTWVASQKALNKFIKSNRRMDANDWGMALADEFNVEIIIFTNEGIKVPNGKEGLYFPPPLEDYALLYENDDGTMNLLAKLEDLMKIDKNRNVLSSVTKLKPGKLGRLPAFMDIFNGQVVRVGVAGPSIPFKDVADVSTVADIDDPDPILHCLAAGDNDNLFVAATDPIAKIAAKARDAAYEWRNGTKQTNHRKRISGCADGLTIVDQFIGKNGKLRGFGMRLKNGQIVDVLALQPVFPLYETKLRPTDAPLRRMSRAAIKDTIHSKLISNASSDGVRFKKCNTPCLALVESKIADPFLIYNKYK